MSTALGAGSPEPLGVSVDARGVNVAVYSAHATAIEFCLFDAAGRVEQQRIRLPERTGNVFHGHIAGIGVGARYGLRAHGAFAPHEGQRFNAAKLLVDPYATLLDRPFRLHETMFAYPRAAGADDLGFDARDSAAHMPKAIVVAADGGPRTRSLRTPWAQTVVYELHVRGFTKRHPGVPAAIRGTFAGLGHRGAIDHLVKLGVTSVEIMPAAAWIDERHLAAAGLTNYWGYNPVALMAPDPRLAPGGWAEIAQTVAALAEAGIETIVDVVLNHSGEGDALGPTLSLRGLDNSSYYRTVPGNARAYIDDSGCGNTLALDAAPVLRLAMDALRTWVRRAGVHGFRFDLATALGRRAAGFDPQAPLLAALQQDPELCALKLVAEPWDVGPGGYQLGRFPASWGEWNDRFRDDVRRFWRGDPGMLGALGARLAGSAELLGAHRRLSRSINFVTAHDGFTLADLVAHTTKHNHANGENNRDGCDANHSWNNGVEGATDDRTIESARYRDQRALLATLLLARGTPMLAMGAELGHSQAGNNNCYAQDNETSWLDWEGADDSLVAFAARLIALRRALAPLGDDRPLTGNAGADGLADVAWLAPSGQPMTTDGWEQPDGGSLLMLLARNGERVAIIVHRGHAPQRFALPGPRPGHGWMLLADSAAHASARQPPASTRAEPQPGSSDAAASDAAAMWRAPASDAAAGVPQHAASIDVAARSVLLLAERPQQPARAHPASPDMLARLADAAGIQSHWWSVDGAEHRVSDDTKRHLLGAMRLPADSAADTRGSLERLAAERERRPLPHALVRRAGEPIELPLALEPGIRRPLWLIISQENGDTTRVLAAPDRCSARAATAVDGSCFERWMVRLPDLPLGHHRVIRDDRPDCVCLLTIAPRRAHLPERLRTGTRLFGVAAQLYALRRAGDQGIGDFTTLADTAAFAADAGAALVGVNPLHALFFDQRDRASPYQPSDRRFLDPIYLDLAALRDVPGAGSAADLANAAATIAALSATMHVDYPQVWRVKQAALAQLYAGFAAWHAGHPSAALARAFDAFSAAGGEPLARFATFCALSEQHPALAWQRWPAALRDPGSNAVQEFRAAHADTLCFYIFLQWLCDRQLGAAAQAMRRRGMEPGLYRDLAVGAAPDGAEAWSSQQLLASGVSIGAPPDPFSAQGQVWGLPPPIPPALSGAGYASFAQLLAANMAHAGALRIDHVMGLSRLFWVPEGADGRDGAYISYPLQDLLGEVALASQRAACMVIGEDLGTVPEGLRDALADVDILGYRVMLLERSGSQFTPPADYPPLSLACVSNHDLPTIVGWWKGADLAERMQLGQLAPADAAAAWEQRAADRASLGTMVLGAAGADASIDPAAAEPPARLLTEAHRALAAGASCLVMLQVDDLAGEEHAINLPGTDAERSNWRRKVAPQLSQLFETARPILAAVARARGPARS